MKKSGLHVGVDARVLAERHTGVAVYTRLILRYLALTRENAWFTLFSHRPIPTSVLDSIGTTERFSVCCLRCPPAMLARPVWDHAFVPIRARSQNLDLFFSPLSVVPRFLSVPTIVTIHDLGFLRFPTIQPWKYRLYWWAVSRRAARSADRIIAVSRSTARDTIELLGADPRRIHVIREAVDPFFLEEPCEEKQSQVLESLGLQPGFVLTVGTLEPRKNYELTLGVFKCLCQKWPDLRVVIVGSKGWLCEDIVHRIHRERDRFLWLDDADNATLRVLYRAASVFLFPSLYEGFGLPLLEAMACGTPVVSSDVGSVPEVVGKAGICIPSMDPEPFVQAVSAILEDSCVYEHFQNEGYKRVRLFSWERAARETWEAFDRALAGR